MTKEEWKIVENSWSNTYTIIHLNCDGFEITLQPLIYKQKLVHSIFVNGYIKGEYMDEKSEEGKRFYRVKESFLYSSKERAERLKMFGKKAYKKFNYDKKMKQLVPDWFSFATLKNHLIANNKEISLIYKDALGLNHYSYNHE